MATELDVKNGLAAAIVAALSAASITGAQVGINFPPDDVIQDVARDTSSVISVYLKHTDFKPIMPFEQSETQNPCGITSTASDFSLAPTQTITITLALATGSTAVNAGDTVSCQLSNGDYNNAATVTAVLGDSLNSLAGKLAAAINAAFPGLVTAGASGPVVSVSITGGNGYHLFTSASNNWAVNKTTAWAYRQFQIIVWTGDPTTDANIHACLENLFRSLDDTFGIALSAETIRVCYRGATPTSADQQKDIYRDNHLLQVEHMATVVQTAYGIVATENAVTVEPIDQWQPV